jgi:LIM homeobox protein 2/9
MQAFAPVSVSGDDDDMTSQRLQPVTELMSAGDEDTNDKRKCSTISGGPVCARCRQSIADRYFLSALGTSWHVGCLSCQHCLRPLDSQMTCFTRDGKIYCRDDYYRYVRFKASFNCYFLLIVVFATRIFAVRRRILQSHTYFFYQ